MRWSPSSTVDLSGERGGGAAGRLVIVCGLPGSGKTTRARAIERGYPSVRFCPDEWMASLAIDLWDADAHARIERLAVAHGGECPPQRRHGDRRVGNVATGGA